MNFDEILIDKPMSWVGNLTDDNESKVKINYVVKSAKSLTKKIFGEETSIVKVDIMIESILSNPSYRTHIIKFCSSGKEGITDKEYVSMTLNLAQDIHKNISEYTDDKVYVSSINCKSLIENFKRRY